MRGTVAWTNEALIVVSHHRKEHRRNRADDAAECPERRLSFSRVFALGKRAAPLPQVFSGLVLSGEGCFFIWKRLPSY